MAVSRTRGKGITETHVANAWVHESPTLFGDGRRMRLRYIANACFLITLSGGRRILSDPWFCGPCQQTWWNFPPVHERLAEEVRQRRPDFLYISHLHHDHLHAESLASFDRATPVIVGAMNTPNLRNALAALDRKSVV